MSNRSHSDVRNLGSRVAATPAPGEGALVGPRGRAPGNREIRMGRGVDLQGRAPARLSQADEPGRRSRRRPPYRYGVFATGAHPPAPAIHTLDRAARRYATLPRPARTLRVRPQRVFEAAQRLPAPVPGHTRGRGG